MALTLIKTGVSKVIPPVQQVGNAMAQNPAIAVVVPPVTQVQTTVNPGMGPALPQQPANLLPQQSVLGANVIQQPISLQGTVIPKKITWTVNSNVALSLTALINLFNNTALLPFSANVVQPIVSCTDGFAGRLIERLLVQAGDKGVMCYGFNVSCTDSVSGLPDTASINAMNAALLNYIGTSNNAVPTPFDVSGTERKTDFKDGLMTIISPFVLYSIGQFQYTQPGFKLFQFTFFFTPIEN